jgi:hypothetical protein
MYTGIPIVFLVLFSTRIRLGCHGRGSFGFTGLGCRFSCEIRFEPIHPCSVKKNRFSLLRLETVLAVPNRPYISFVIKYLTNAFHFHVPLLPCPTGSSRSMLTTCSETHTDSCKLVQGSARAPPRAMPLKQFPVTFVCPPGRGSHHGRSYPGSSTSPRLLLSFRRRLDHTTAVLHGWSQAFSFSS